MHAHAQEMKRAPIEAAAPCMRAASLAEKLTEARIGGHDRANAAALLTTVVPDLSPELRQDALVKAYGFSYSRLNPLAMASFVFLSCHYKTDEQITPLLAKLAANCQARHSAFEPLARCVENVMLGLPPT